jgi:hypothetical protein
VGPAWSRIERVAGDKRSPGAVVIRRLSLSSVRPSVCLSKCPGEPAETQSASVLWNTTAATTKKAENAIANRCPSCWPVIAARRRVPFAIKCAPLAYNCVARRSAPASNSFNRVLMFVGGRFRSVGGRAAGGEPAERPSGGSQFVTRLLADHSQDLISPRRDGRERAGARRPAVVCRRQRSAHNRAPKQCPRVQPRPHHRMAAPLFRLPQ